MFEKLNKELEAAHQAIVDLGKAAIKPAILEFMAAHPEVAQLKWTSGTPSFNDGDPCQWSMHEPEVKLASQAISETPTEPDDEDDESDDDDEDFLCSWSFPENLPGRAQLKTDLQSLYQVLQSAEAAVRSMFGDDVKVIVGRDGEATVSEYDMGY